MQGKKELIKNLLIKNIHLFRCPICESQLCLQENSLMCEHHHLFDISKKGVVLLHKKYQKKIDEIYTKNLFINRRLFINEEFYLEVHEYIKDIIFDVGNNIQILDLGAGECSHLKKIKGNQTHSSIGIDLSYDAISLATDYLANDILPICCDLYNLPFTDNVFDIVLNFLSPINSKEVSRVLKDNGLIIKIVPTSEYLKELRNSLGLKEYQKEDEVLENLTEHYSIVSTKRIETEKTLSKTSLQHLFYMTPMTSHNNIDNIACLSFDKITISLNVIVLKKK